MTTTATCNFTPLNPRYNLSGEEQKELGQYYLKGVTSSKGSLTINRIFSIFSYTLETELLNIFQEHLNRCPLCKKEKYGRTIPLLLGNVELLVYPESYSDGFSFDFISYSPESLQLNRYIDRESAKVYYSKNPIKLEKRQRKKLGIDKSDFQELFYRAFLYLLSQRAGEKEKPLFFYYKKASYLTYHSEIDDKIRIIALSLKKKDPALSFICPGAKLRPEVTAPYDTFVEISEKKLNSLNSEGIKFYPPSDFPS